MQLVAIAPNGSNVDASVTSLDSTLQNVVTETCDDVESVSKTKRKRKSSGNFGNDATDKDEEEKLENTETEVVVDLDFDMLTIAGQLVIRNEAFDRNTEAK